MITTRSPPATEPRKAPMPTITATPARADAWRLAVDGPDLHRRWTALGDLPDHSLGEHVFWFYRARGFEFPGATGSALRCSPNTTGSTWSPTTATRLADAMRRGALARTIDDTSVDLLTTDWFALAPWCGRP